MEVHECVQNLLKSDMCIRINALKDIYKILISASSRRVSFILDLSFHDEIFQIISHLIDLGAIPIFIHFLSNDNEPIIEHSLNVLGSIAFQSIKFRDLILAAGAANYVIQCIQAHLHNSHIQRNGTWLLSNFFIENFSLPFTYFQQTIQLLSILLGLFPDDNVIKCNVFRCIYFMTKTNQNVHEIQTVIKSGIVPSVISNLNCGDSNVQYWISNIIENLVLEKAEISQIALDLPLTLKSIQQELQNSPQFIQQMRLFSIILTLSKRPAFHQLLIDANFIPTLCHFIESGDWFIRYKVADVLYNLTRSRCPQHIQYLSQQNVIRLLYENLMDSNEFTSELCLGGLVNIVNAGNNVAYFGLSNPFVQMIEECHQSVAVNYLELLKSHPNSYISKKASQILDIRSSCSCKLLDQTNDWFCNFFFYFSFCFFKISQ